jgi:hypothetical protein
VALAIRSKFKKQQLQLNKSRELKMPSSTGIDTESCGPDASRMMAVPRRDLSLLTDEERITYRKWRHATLVVYSAVAIIIAVLSIAVGPTDTSSTNEIHSALAPQAASRTQR